MAVHSGAGAGNAPLQSTIINLINTILGAGMLALPLAFKEMGIVLACSMIVFAAFTTGIGLMFQGYAAGYLPKGEASFFAVSKITYPSLAVIFDVAIALKCFGVSISYLVITADLMPIVAQYFGASDDSFFTSRLTWLILSMLIVTPLAFKKTLDSLKTASVIALSSVVYLVVIVVGHFLKGDTIAERGPINIVHAEGGIPGFLVSLPIMVFAYTCAQNMFASLNEMRNDSLQSTSFVVVFCMTTATTVYITVGLAGYLSYGSNVGNNIIAMYAQSLWSTLGRFAIVVLVIFSYPLMIHPARASVTNVLADMRAKPRSTDREDSEIETTIETTPLIGAQPHHGVRQITPAVSDGEHFGVTAALLIASFVIAAVINSLDVILSFVGSTGATIISFILPGVFGYSLSKSTFENRLVSLTPKRQLVLRCVSLALITWGVTVMVLCLSMNIYKLVTGSSF